MIVELGLEEELVQLGIGGARKFYGKYRSYDYSGKTK